MGDYRLQGNYGSYFQFTPVVQECYIGFILQAYMDFLIYGRLGNWKRLSTYFSSHQYFASCGMCSSCLSCTVAAWIRKIAGGNLYAYFCNTSCQCAYSCM